MNLLFFMIKGWLKTTLIDYPGEIASIVFTGGCNMRCPMCHNADVVLHPKQFPSVPAQEIFDYLDKRQGKVSGIVISGGEPTLSPDLEKFMHELRKRPIKIKLDSNGLRPDLLEHFYAEKLIDYLAMDIKAPLPKYSELCGVDIDMDRIQRSIDLIRSSGLPYEFRTTVVPDLLLPEDIVAIGEWLHGSKRYALQQFHPDHCLNPDFDQLSPYPAKVLEEMKTSVEPHFGTVVLRGV